MTTNAQLIERSNQIARENEAQELHMCYVIKLVKTGVYVAPRRMYTQDSAQAVHYDFMTLACVAAIELLDLALEDFEIESVTCAKRS